MRKWEVMGFKNVNYKSKKTGNQVEGSNLYLRSPAVSDDVEGDECKEVFISRKSVAYAPTVGDTVNIIYNEYGYVENVVSCY